VGHGASLESSVMPARAAGICGLLAFVTVNLGWILGELAQPSAYSPANDDISDLGALTANSAWLYNQVGSNLTGALVVVLGLGLWRALSPDVLGRVGSLAVISRGARSLSGRDLPARLPGDRRLLHERLLALACAQDRVRHHRRRDAAGAADPRLRLPSHPRLA